LQSKIFHKDRVLGIALLGITVFFAYHTRKLPKSIVVGDPGPKVFPYIGCFLTGAIGLSYLFKGKRGEIVEFLNNAEWKRLIILFSYYVLFFLVLWLFGYFVAIPVATFMISRLFSKESAIKTRTLIIYTVLVSAGIYVSYVVALGSTLPKGIFWRLF